MSSQCLFLLLLCLWFFHRHTKHLFKAKMQNSFKILFFWLLYFIWLTKLRRWFSRNVLLLVVSRRMLHELSEHMVADDVKQLKHIIKNTQSIQRARLEEAPDAYSLFLLLEKRQLISSTDVSRLLSFTDQMDEVGLSLIVSKYKGV